MIVVSIRCRARRTAKQEYLEGLQANLEGFYSLSCETYSATGGNRHNHQGPLFRFYSLSCETYGATRGQR